MVMMPRRERPANTERSEHWLRVAVNEHTAALNAKIIGLFNWHSSERIEWVSPIASDNYAEYFDDEFLIKLDVRNKKVSLKTFWPAGGPRWDGLAKTLSGKLILVEAKAHIGEIVSQTRASPRSLKKIQAAITSTKRAFEAPDEAPWESPFYQYANRLAHLYFLRELNELDANLLFVYFADAPDVPAPERCTADQWNGAIRLTEKALRVGSQRYRGHFKSLIWSVPTMLLER
jgi:hypothetical protein